MKFLVTGGAGFIGSSIVKELIKLPDSRVKIIDIMRPDASEKRIKFYQADISLLKDIEDIFSDVDYVFHCGAYAKIEECIKNPGLAARVNVLGTYNVLSTALAKKVKRVVYSASASVYGFQEQPFLREDLKPSPQNPYAETKYIGEILCRDFSREFRLETICLRYFNVYGSMPAIEGKTFAPSVIEIFLHQRFSNQPLTIVGDGSQKRDFVHISDVVAANMAAMKNPRVAKGEPINIGSGKSYRIAEIAEFISNQKIDVRRNYGEASTTRADISRAQSLLGWSPRVELKSWIDGILKSF